MITINLEIGSMIIGMVLGFAISFFCFWLAERNCPQFMMGYEAGQNKYQSKENKNDHS